MSILETQFGARRSIARKSFILPSISDIQLSLLSCYLYKNTFIRHVLSPSFVDLIVLWDDMQIICDYTSYNHRPNCPCAVWSVIIWRVIIAAMQINITKFARVLFQMVAVLFVLKDRNDHLLPTQPGSYLHRRLCFRELLRTLVACSYAQHHGWLWPLLLT